MSRKIPLPCLPLLLMCTAWPHLISGQNVDLTNPIADKTKTPSRLRDTKISVFRGQYVEELKDLVPTVKAAFHSNQFCLLVAISLLTCFVDDFDTMLPIREALGFDVAVCTPRLSCYDLIPHVMLEPWFSGLVAVCSSGAFIEIEIVIIIAGKELTTWILVVWFCPDRNGEAVRNFSLPGPAGWSVEYYYA